jgi:hypothetical protein
MDASVGSPRMSPAVRGRALGFPPRCAEAASNFPGQPTRCRGFDSPETEQNAVQSPVLK